MSSILDKILVNKRLEVERLKIEKPLSSLRLSASEAALPSFRAALAVPDRVNIVAELKKASPSRGQLLEEFEPSVLAAEYTSGGAAALSVLTEQKYFLGRAEYMRIASEHSGLPILCKDFIFDRYQLHYARFMGASAVLLIVRMLTPDQLSSLISEASDLGLDCLVEVHDEDELVTALVCNARIVGVNNRNLEDFSVKLETSERLAQLIPTNVIRVAESGIFTRDDIRRLRMSDYNCFLIGEALIRSENRMALIEELRTA